MISVAEAIDQILQTIPALGKERLPLLQSLGRVLGEEVIARRNIPPWDNSAMDGYAVRWEDVQGAKPENPAVLNVRGDLPAGRVFQGELGAGESIRIMTGAPLPPGADTVVQVEDTAPAGVQVRIFAAPGRGKNIRRSGEDVKAGDVVLAEGTVLQPAHVGMLASLQRSAVLVRQRPRVAILSTGDELLEIDDPWENGKIINSNSYSLAAQVAACGGDPIQLGIARDRPEELADRIRQGFAADLLLTSGGVSVGDYDFVKEMLGRLGKVNFWKVAMRPGQPLVFGILAGKPIFGLPGNPVSSMVSFENFVRPSLLKMAGHRNLFRPSVKAVLRESIEKKAGLVHFIRCLLIKERDALFATTTGEQGSGILSSMVRAQGLLVLPAERPLVPAGEEVRVLLLDPWYSYAPFPDYLS